MPHPGAGGFLFSAYAGGGRGRYTSDMAELWMVAGPIGNLGDLSPRASEILQAATLWIVEDTRVSSRLAAHLGVKPVYKVLNDHTSPARVRALADEIESHEQAALLTDAGTPGISDPGAELVQACLERDIRVDGIPGPSAVTFALSVCGFYAQRFAFLGFLPRKAGDIQRTLASFAENSMTLVLFESPHRLTKAARMWADALGNRRVVVARELTKRHQELWRGTLEELAGAPREWKGETTVVIEGHRRLIVE